MKKISILIISIFVLLSCSKDDNDYIKYNLFGQGTYVPNLPNGQLLAFNPAVLNFAAVLINTPSTKTIIITNNSNYSFPVTVSSSSVQLTTNVNSFQIPANGSYQLTTIYRPTATTILQVSLLFSYGNNSSAVNVTGLGVSQLPTTLTYSPPGILDFGMVAVGQTVTRNISLNNTGTAVANWTPVGNIFTFAPTSGTINVGNSQQVALSFSATAAGIYNNTQTFSYNGGTIQIPYTVNRIAATRIIGVICTTPTAFGNVPINTTVTKTITISNTGNSNLTVSQITTSQVPNGQFTCSYSGVIPPNSSINVPISFRPTSVGSKSCTINVQSDRTSGINSLSFNGFGI